MVDLCKGRKTLTLLLVHKDVVMITTIQTIISTDVAIRNCKLYSSGFMKDFCKTSSNTFWKEFKE
jgi:hypothetical protein